MDPDATLAQIRDLIKQGRNARQDAVAADRYSEAIELFMGLDEWLKRGGFKPHDWRCPDGT